MNILYRSETGRDFDEAQEDMAEGVVVEQVRTSAGLVTLREGYDETTPTGVAWSVSSVREGCNDDCRYEMCHHGDWDLHFSFPDEATARAKFAYLAKYTEEVR